MSYVADLTLFSIPLQGRWWRIQVNEIMMRIRYRMHNHYVSTVRYSWGTND